MMPPKLNVFRVRWHPQDDKSDNKLRLLCVCGFAKGASHILHNGGDDLNLNTAIVCLQKAGYSITGQFEYKGDWFLTVEN